MTKASAGRASAGKASAGKASADKASAGKASAGKASLLPTLFLPTLFLPTLCPPTGLAWAKEPAKKKPDAAAMAAQQAEERIRAAKALLNGTQWAIELTPMSGEQPKRPAKDTLRFEQNTVVSEQLGGAGFSPTGYSLTVAEDGTTVWETMQTSADTSVIFWRGELQGETMRGTLSKHPAKGNAVDLAFSGTRMPSAPAAEAAPPAVTAPAPPPAEAPPAPVKPAEKPKKKRGWWR